MLDPAVPGFAAIERIAAAQGAVLLRERPNALDLGRPDAARALAAWLAAGDTLPRWARSPDDHRRGA